MRVKGFVLVVAAVLLLGGGTALAGVNTVYVSNPDMDRIYALPTAPGSTPTEAYYEAGSNYEDLVVAPDGMIFACDPSRGKIVSFNPAPPTTDTIWSYTASPGAPGPARPQCGWFTNSGDLVVTDKGASDNAVWLFRADPKNFYQQCGDQYPWCRIDVDAAFVGAGVTQAADGELLAVDRGQRIVWSLGYDLYRQAFYTADQLIFGSAVNDPIGIARSSRGNIYLAVAPNRLLKYDWSGAPATIPACATAFGNKDRPYFLDFAADDTLYVATTSNNSGKVWALNVEGCDCVAGNSIPDCNAPRVVYEFRKQAGYEISTVGIGVPYMPGSGGLGTFLDGKPSTTADGSQLFNFYDHAYEFKAEPAGCEVRVSAADATPTYLADLVDTIDLAPYDPDYPGCEDPGNPTYPCDIAARPVLYLGENGRGVLYDVIPDPDATPSLCYGDPGAILFRHAINAYAGYVPNPRMIRCPTPSSCMLLDLNTYFPYNGIFPDDTRIGSTNGSSTSDFSTYFMVDLDLNTNAQTGDGVFCGFESPWYEPTLPAGVDWNDADVLDHIDTNGLVAISNTSSFAFKFKIAQITSYNTDGSPIYSCDAGPYITSAIVLMSVARVRDPYNVPLDQFEPKRVYSAGSSAVVDPALFNEADNPTKQYHFNAKFPSFEYSQGIYQVVLVPLTNNFQAEVRYFRIVP